MYQYLYPFYEKNKYSTVWLYRILSVHQLMGLLPLFGYSVEPCECHCTHCLVDVFSFLLGIYPEVTFLGHSITVLKNLSNCVMAAPSSIGPVYEASGLSFLSLHQHTVRA